MRSLEGKLGLKFGKSDANFPVVTGLSAGSMLAEQCPQVQVGMSLIALTTSGGARRDVSRMAPAEVKRFLAPGSERPVTLSFGGAVDIEQQPGESDEANLARISA